MHRTWLPALVMAVVFGQAPQIAGAQDLVVSGVRERLKAKMATTPYAASPEQLCAMAAATLAADSRREGDANSPHGQLWNGDRTTGIDCSAEFGAWPATDGPVRRVHMPVQAEDGRIFMTVDDLCHDICYAGTGYELRLSDGAWSAIPSGYSWNL